MFKRILMAFKFTPNCRTALAKAAQMAKDQNSELYVYHALNYRLATIDRQDPRIVEMVGEANKKFEEEVRPYAGDMPIHTFECTPADPGLEICKVARRIGADLILMGSHNESEKPNLSRVNYVGMTILEKAPCPVMLVPA
ncbi:MAG: universal stress protein [Desulfobacterales bacterium]